MSAARESETIRHSRTPARRYRTLDTFTAEEDRAFWCFMEPAERPVFTRQLLADLLLMQSDIVQQFQEAETGARPFDYVVLGSRHRVFNLGGDLTFFQDAIRRRDAAALRAYAYACITAGHANYSGYCNRVITIALMSGDAMGGGLEAALTCDVRIAERSALLGFPEVLFNMFPGMGAHSFLVRLLGPMGAEEVVRSGRLYTAQQMHELGIVHIVAEDGQGERVAREYIEANKGRHNAHAAMYEAGRLANPVPAAELRAIADLWVEAALRLTPGDLRRMSILSARTAASFARESRT